MRRRPFDLNPMGAVTLAACVATGLGVLPVGAAPGGKVGPEHRAAPAPPAVFAPGGSHSRGLRGTASGNWICLEAEWGTLTGPLQIREGSDPSGGQYVQLPAGAGPAAEGVKLPGDCSVSFSGAAGTYRVWARVWWPDAVANSLSVAPDGGEMSVLTDGSARRWHWVPGPKFVLMAGKHALVLRDFGPGVGVDQLFLTRDPDRVPVGREKVTPATRAR